jgi:hypothetical protein
MHFLCQFAIAVAVGAAVQENRPAGAMEEYVLMSTSARPDACNLAMATNMPLAELIQNPEKWSSKCVAVDGFWRYRALFSTARDANRRQSQSGTEVAGRRIGIYGTDALLGSAPHRPAAYLAVDIAGRCETLGDGAIMVMGYCHYTGGPYLAAAEMHRR